MSTLAADLAHLRLTLRARRLEQVVAALHERRSDRAASGAVPPPLDLAIADFTNELATVRMRLDDDEG